MSELINNKHKQIVYTLTAKCRDCYKCLKKCPVKAIKMKDSQAYIDEEKCIACGTCIKVCPQNAKMYRKDIEKVKDILNNNKNTAVSIAPSFSVLFENWEIKRLVSALRMLGFKYVGETSIGAFHVAKVTKELFNKQKKLSFCTACPAFVSYIEKYHEKLVENLLNVVSPMIAHAKHIKRQFGADFKIIFIGPCIAKKKEAERVENENIIDAVITFEEMFEWFEEKNIKLANLEESDFDETPAGYSRLFPIPGGLAKTASMDDSILSKETLNISGIESIEDFTSNYNKDYMKWMIEPLFCKEGCIAGPGMDRVISQFKSKKALIDYHDNNEINNNEGFIVFNDLITEYSYTGQKGTRHSEAEIKAILAKTGKISTDDELNCGACGYSSCREKAIAVLDGMAELEMCIPYMRRLAEQRADKIIETSPNGIIILNKELKVLKINTAFQKMFKCGISAVGKNVSYLMDSTPFEKLAASDTEKIEQSFEYKEHNLFCHEIYYELKEESQFIGIFVNITNYKKERVKVKIIKEQTILQANEFLEHQINMAQKIAEFLGQNTAKSEKLIKNLLNIAEEKDK